MLQPRAPPVLGPKRAIGSGATSTVYCAEVLDRGGFSRLNLRQPVAIKEMIGVDRKTIAAIELEVAMHKAIVHPNIVSYLGFFVAEDSGTDRNRVNILLEYCDGGSLFHAYEHGPLSEATVKSYLYQALKGLQYLHARGVVHRDVKGLNLLLTRGRVCKLGDFGCAVDLATRKDGQFHSMKGTPFWMAPETFEVSETGLGGTSAADIWSIGATAWELATADRPFRNVSNDMQLILFLCEAQSDDALFPTDLEERVGAATYGFIRRCMRRAPAERPTADALLRDPYFAECVATEERLRHSSAMSGFTTADQAKDADPADDFQTPDGPFVPLAVVGSFAPLAVPGLEQAMAGRDPATRQWLQNAIGAASPVPTASPESSTSSTDESQKLRPAMEWWAAQGFGVETTASAFFDALKCPNLLSQLLPVVVWGSDEQVNSGSSDGSNAVPSHVRVTDFIRFVQFFGPFENLASDAAELGGEGSDYGGYSGYGNYGYQSDTPHMILTWHSREWFKPTWSQARAEEFLKGCPPGCFVIRFSSRWKESPGSYTLSVKGERGVSHYRVVRPQSNCWSFVLAPHGTETFYYDAIEELVVHLQQFGVKSVKSDRIHKLI